MVRAVVVRLQEERSLCPVVVAEQAAPAVEAPADLVVLAVAEQAAARLQLIPAVELVVLAVAQLRSVVADPAAQV